MMRRRSLLAGAALLPWAGLAWAQPGEVLLSRYGRAVVAQPRRVFAAGPPAAVLVAALAPEALLGWPQTLPPEARGLLSPTLAALPTTGRLAGRGSTVSIEALLAMRPDLILDAGTVDDHYRSTAERVAAQTGIPFALVDGRIAQSAQQLREVGRFLGVAPRGEALAAYADTVLAQARRQREQALSTPARVYLARGVDGLETGWSGSINAELLEFVGARNVADAPATGAVRRVSIEQVLAWNPDLIVTQQPGLAHQLRQAPTWRSLNAVRNGRVLQVPHLPFGWIDGPPGVNRLLGLSWLLATLVDGAAAGTFEAEARRFHQLFFGMPAGLAWPPGSLP